VVTVDPSPPIVALALDPEEDEDEDEDDAEEELSCFGRITVKYTANTTAITIKNKGRGYES